MGLMTEVAFVRSPLGGGRFSCMTTIASLDVGNLMVLVAIDARPCVCRASRPECCHSPFILVTSGTLFGSRLGTYMRLVAIPAAAVRCVGSNGLALVFMAAQTHFGRD